MGGHAVQFKGCFASIFLFFDKIFPTFHSPFVLYSFYAPLERNTFVFLAYYFSLYLFGELEMEIFIEIKLLLIKRTSYFSTIFIIGFVCRDSIIFFTAKFDVE